MICDEITMTHCSVSLEIMHLYAPYIIALLHLWHYHAMLACKHGDSAVTVVWYWCMCVCMCPYLVTVVLYGCSSSVSDLCIILSLIAITVELSASYFMDQCFVSQEFSHLCHILLYSCRHDTTQHADSLIIASYEYFYLLCDSALKLTVRSHRSQTSNQLLLPLVSTSSLVDKWQHGEIWLFGDIGISNAQVSDVATWRAINIVDSNYSVACWVTAGRLGKAPNPLRNP